MADPAVLEATHGEAMSARGSAARARFWAPLTCLAAAVAASGTLLLVLESRLTFFADDWIFLLDRRGSSASAFLDPHNDHIALAPAALYKALLALFGMDSVLPFGFVSTVIFLLSAVLLFLYVRRRAGSWPALLGSVLILFLGASWIDLLWPFQIGFSGSIAAGLGALLALDRDDREGDLVACALLLVSISFSELGVCFAVGALVSVALGPSPRLNRLYAPLVPVALYGVWYLGWGHTAPHNASFHNLVNSPKFVFDLASQNLASLLGLGPVRLTRGRILLVIAIGVATWRLWRSRGPGRSLWVVLAAGGAFWFLTALNAIPVLRTPMSGRYQYPGAVFVVLIAAEVLRGARIGKWALVVATAITVAAAVGGVLSIRDGYHTLKAVSDDLRARLAAVEIGRGHESGNLPVFFFGSRGSFLFIARPASRYLSAVDAFGSPAFDEAELVARKETNRAAADRQLASAEGIRLRSAAPGVEPSARRAGRCHTFTGSPSSPPPLAVGPGNYTISAPRRPGAAGQAGLPLFAARFAEKPSINLGVAPPRAELRLPHDRSARPWRLYWPPGRAVTVCNGVR